MTIRNSKFVLAAAALASITLLVVLALEEYGLYVKYGEAAKLSKARQETLAKEISFKSLRSLQASAKADLLAFESVSFSSDKTVSVIDRLERAAGQLGVFAKIASVENVPAEGLRMTIESRGGWRGVFALLQVVENLPYRVIFERVEFTKSANAWDLNLDVLMPVFD